MKMKKNVVKQILSLMMAVIVLVSGVSIPAKANEVIPDEEIVVGGDLKEDASDAGQEEVTDTTQELLTDTPTVYFENISGEKIPVTEGGTIELSALDEGRFVIEGIGEKSAEGVLCLKLQTMKTKFVTSGGLQRIQDNGSLLSLWLSR